MTVPQFLLAEGFKGVAPIVHLPDGYIPLPPGVPAVKVLIADTDAYGTRSIQRPLEGGGYSVLVTRTGHQTLQAVYQQHPDLVLLGSHLHEANSHLICQQIKSDKNLGFLPVILMADYASEASVVVYEDEALNPDAVLTKPVDIAELANWLQIMLKLKTQFDRKLDRLASEARRLEILKTEIISNISHELGTPLLQVKSAISLLAEMIQQNNSRDQLRLADMATQAVARLEHEVNNIRQLARTHDIRLGPVVLQESVQLALRHLERSWNSREDVRRVQVDQPGRMLFVLADKRALARLLQVLLDNALKFSPSSEPVLVRVQALDNGRVRLSIQDFGIGIPPEEHDRIFDAFYKVDGSSTQQFGGSGTGLALAMLLASGMNITIHVESVPGQGSTFSFVLPLVDLDDDHDDDFDGDGYAGDPVLA